jgi:hypothetical protein
MTTITGALETMELTATGTLAMATTAFAHRKGTIALVSQMTGMHRDR